MTTITMERLVELPEGASVSIGPRQIAWTVGPNRSLVRDSFTVPVEQFAGEVEAGNVREGVPFRAGQWWRYAARDRYLYVVQENGNAADCVWFRGNGSYLSIDMGRESQEHLTLASELPDWAADRTNTATAIWGAQHQQQQVQTRLDRTIAEHREALERVREGHAAQLTRLGESLLEYVQQDMDEDLLSILREHGLPLPQETVEVEIEVSGQSTHYFDTDELQGKAPEGANVTSGTDVRIDWERTVTHSMEVNHGDCACQNITRSHVQDALRASGITDWYDLDWSTNCVNC